MARFGWGDNDLKPWWIKESDFSTTPIRHIANDESLQLALAKQGLGMSMLPCFMGDAEPSLRHVPPANILPSHDVWILTHVDFRNTAKVSSFIQFMVKEFEQLSDLLEGRLPN